MPIIKSAIKRVRQSAKRQTRNRVTKRQYRELVKDYLKLITDGKVAEAVKFFPKVQKAIDLATKKNMLHANTAGRKKSQLVKMLDKKVTPKTETKKPATKKSVAKKPAPKKAK